jgi:hypothetical protein
VLAGVEYEHGMQRGVELLSAGEASLWWRGSVQASGFARGRSVPIYTETAGVRCARSGEEKKGGRQQGIGRDGRRGNVSERRRHGLEGSAASGSRGLACKVVSSRACQVFDGISVALLGRVRAEEVGEGLVRARAS